MNVQHISNFCENIISENILEIRLPQNLAKIDLVIRDLCVISNFKAGLSNQG